MFTRVNELEAKAHQLNQQLFQTIDALMTSLKETERKLQQKVDELDAANQRFKLVLGAVNVGIWDWLDLEQDEAYLNDQFYIQVGYQPGEFPPKFSSVLTLTHPEDRQMLKEAVDDHLMHNTPFQIETRRQMKSGEYRWFSTTGKCLRNAEGKAIRMAGSTVDVHEKKLAELEIQALNQELEANNKEMLAQNEELISLNEEIKAINDQLEVIVDIRAGEVAEKNAALEKTVVELENRNFELDNIVYKISHDIRSPIASMLGILHLAEQEKDKQEVPLYIKMARQQAERLDHFVFSMLNFAKANRSDIQTDPIDFREILDRCFAALKYHPNYGVLQKKVLIEQEPSRPFYSDALRLEVILMNLLSNAMKYLNSRQEEPMVKISIRVKKEAANIQLCDNGIGIHQQYLPHVFDMFYRASEQSKGSGLGLYIVKKTVEKLKGQISINSQLGEFTHISLQIPNGKKPKEGNAEN